MRLMLQDCLRDLAINTAELYVKYIKRHVPREVRIEVRIVSGLGVERVMYMLSEPAYGDKRVERGNGSKRRV